MVVNKMVIKLDNANKDIRRHEDELRRLSRECAPMMHGHPTLRRRITNELQPQINKLNHEMRALKVSVKILFYELSKVTWYRHNFTGSFFDRFYRRRCVSN